jgi:hypothetical protein
MLKGGIADKLGNDYEALWTLVEALRVLRGQADEIRIEPFNEDAKGIEFRINALGRTAWHQCKRRLRSGSWTIAALESAGILSDFMRKLAAPQNDCVFVSGDPAPDLKTLAGKAAIVGSSTDFLDSLSKKDELSLAELAQIWTVNPETLFDWLRRVRVETVSEGSLKRELSGLCALLFTGDPGVAIERLAGFLDDTVTQVVTTESFRAAVDARGLGWRARFDETLKAKLATATDNYLSSLGQPIAGVEIETEDLADAVQAALDGPRPLTIVSGSAGSGKSLALAKIVSAARHRNWPVLALRVDWFLDTRALTDLGAILVGREENPVGILGNQAGGADCLLVIDQVDAVSEASGRSGRIRELVFQMLHAASYFPHFRVVIACRSYDLDNDSRLKALESDAKAVAVRLKPLDWIESVQPVLLKLGLGARHFSDRQRQVLSLPINLLIFASLVDAGAAVADDLTGAQLFDSLVELRARQLRTANVTWSVHTALAHLASWMSSNQVLTAPVSVLAPFPGAADVLSSQGLIAKAATKIQFTHESFFDHVFSADFVTRGDSVLTLLKSDKQRLFRRTQVRQIFARLRDQGGRKYLVDLRDVMNSAEVRYLVKDAVAAWLASVSEPSSAELEIVEGWWERGQSFERLARTVTAGQQWLPRLIASGSLTSLIASGGPKRDFALWLLRRGVAEHTGPVADYLRKWWNGDQRRTPELLAWFDRLYPDGSIGELELLYRDAIAVAPLETLKSQFEGDFEIGALLHKKDYPLGARVLGWWLNRWMEVFTDTHPFGRGKGAKNRHWIKELAEHAPAAFLDAAWAPLAEGLRRERLELAAGRLSFPTIRLDGEDDAWILLVGNALTKVASEAPDQAAAYLAALPTEGAPALWLHLRAIAADGPTLSHRLGSLLNAPELFELGRHGGAWRPFAEAAHSAAPFLSESDRRQLEAKVMRHRPEYELACRLMGLRGEGNRPLSPNDRIYACGLIGRTGEEERAILRTIGASRLGPQATSRLSELERKFADRPLPQTNKLRGGWVRSPITPEKASLMSDSQWLSAIRRYSGNERHTYRSDGIVGGAEQLARVLQGLVKDQSSRFVGLLERFPTDTDVAYVRAVLGGLREKADNKDETVVGLKAFRAASRWRRSRFRREISWLVERWPEMGADREVLDELLSIATHGEASDTTVTLSRPAENTRVQDLLVGDENLETSGINGDRGVAWRALAAVLWVDSTAIEPIAGLLESAISSNSELTSVRMCMFEAVNATIKHDVMRGLSLLEKLAAQDLLAVHSASGRHVLQWAARNHTSVVQPILNRLSQSSEDERLRALGLALEAGLALNDDERESAFLELFDDDVLRRRVAAFVAAANLGSGSVGDRSERWLRRLFHDSESEVRNEALLMDWGSVLDAPGDRTDFAFAFLRSPAFADDPEHLMRAIEGRIDRFPSLAFEAVTHLLGRQEQWTVDGRQRYSLAMHNLGKVLVALYRATEVDSNSEDRLLDLLDKYLASDLRDLGDEIRAYERH